MHPITHLLCGWSVANATSLERRERAAVAIAGVIPDLDGLGMLVDLATRGSAEPTNYYGAWHHLLGHNLGFALVCTGIAALVARRRALAAVLAFLSFHLHLAGDLCGGRGPDGHQWPIPYLLPFAREPELAWSGQWALHAWPNFCLTGVLIALALYLAWRRGFSPLELVSRRADRALVRTLRARFGEPRTLSR